MEGGRRAVCASDGDEKEGAWRRASRHADQHGQPGVDVLESRPIEGGHRADGEVCTVKDKGPRRQTSLYSIFFYGVDGMRERERLKVVDALHDCVGSDKS